MGIERIYDPVTDTITDVDLPPPTIEELKAAKLMDLAECRWRHECGGTIVGGLPILTDRESRAILTGAVVNAKDDPAFTVRWKVGAGQFVTLDAATIVAIGNAVTAHVQACFNREDTLTSEIQAAFEAEDPAALEAVDIEAGWP